MFATIMPPHFQLLGLFLCLWLVVLTVLGRAAWRLRDSTLAWPTAWSIIAWFAVLQTILVPFGLAYPIYVAAVAMIAPTLALLGAKRPQNGAWQFIVGTLVMVLLLPALRGIVFGDQIPHVHALFRWLIAVHIFIGTVNYLPTRYAIPAVLYGTAQFQMASFYLPFASSKKEDPIVVAVPCAVAAVLWAACEAWRSESRPRGVDRLWFDFRDAYGLVWGLRIAERLNASALKHGWPVEFTWGGILWGDRGLPDAQRRTTAKEAIDVDVRHRVERELRSHLRRFVSHDWIARRLNEPQNTAP